MNGKSFRRRDEGKKFLLTATEAYEEDGTVSNDLSICLTAGLSLCMHVFMSVFDYLLLPRCPF